MFGERLAGSHDSVFFLVDCGFELVFFLVVFLAPSLFLLFSFPFDIIEPLSQLFKSHLFQQTNTHILDLLFGAGADLFFQLADLLDELLFLLHLDALLLLFLLLDAFAFLDFLVAHFLVLLDDFFTFHCYVLLALLHLLDQVFLIL